MSIRIELKSLIEAYMEAPIRVIVLADTSPIRFEGKVVEVKRGEELELPRWLALALIEKGIVKPREPTPITISELSRYAYLESRSSHPSSIQKVPEDLYRMFREYVAVLRAKLKREFDPTVLEELRKAEFFMSEIIGRRLSKIIRAALGGGEVKDIIGKLTPEERVLYNSVKALIASWRRTLFEEVIEGGGA